MIISTNSVNLEENMKIKCYKAEICMVLPKASPLLLLKKKNEYQSASYVRFRKRLAGNYYFLLQGFIMRTCSLPTISCQELQLG